MIGRKRQPSERDLAALADGTLPASRRPEVERGVTSSPELEADLAAQRRALAAVAVAAGERAPSALRARLELARDPHHGLRRPRRSWAAVPAVAAVAAVIVLAVGGSPTGAPTVASAATLANRAPALPVGAADGPVLLWPTAGGLSFPNWARRFGFVAAGMRSDRLNGRLATTVFYNRGRDQVAYTIVSGRVLRDGAATHASFRDGTRLWNFTKGGRVVVTWMRGGHSCVLTGKPALLGQLKQLAAWTPPAYRA